MIDILNIKNLAIFDMDGTLLPNTTAAREIAKASNTLEEIKALEQSYNDGQVCSMEFSKIANRLWEKSEKDLYEKAWCNAPKLLNIDSTIKLLQDKGYITCLITMAPIEFAMNFKVFDHVYGSVYGEKILNPEDKPEIAKMLMHKYDVPVENTIAFGDSFSDIPLFQLVSNSVAVNSSREFNSLAKYVYQGACLREAVTVALALGDK